MTDSEDAAAPVGETLLHRGWRQGSLCSAPSTASSWNEAPTSASEALPMRVVKAREKLVIVSQDCDILATGEPYVEAMICTPEKRTGYLQQIDLNSARWFVVDPASGLVAQAKYRLSLAKERVLGLVPQPWPSTPLRFRRFVRWLGRRYDRPAVPDAIVRGFQDPLREILSQLGQSGSDTLFAFTNLVRECRIYVPTEQRPPYAVRLILLAERAKLTQSEANAVSTIEERIRRSLGVDISLEEVRLLTTNLMSVAEYEATIPLFLEYLTYRGEGIIGLEPPQSA